MRRGGDATSNGGAGGRGFAGSTTRREPRPRHELQRARRQARSAKPSSTSNPTRLTVPTAANFCAESHAPLAWAWTVPAYVHGVTHASSKIPQ
jgi:hypothetical protein